MFSSRILMAEEIVTLVCISGFFALAFFFFLFIFSFAWCFFPFLTMNTGNVEASRLQSSISPADLHGMWYPTVRRTLVCLSKLYRCIDVSPHFLILSVDNILIYNASLLCTFASLFFPVLLIVSCFCFDFLQRAVFQGLSQEALSACIQSLLKASDIILKNKVGIHYMLKSRVQLLYFHWTFLFYYYKNSWKCAVLLS